METYFGSCDSAAGGCYGGERMAGLSISLKHCCGRRLSASNVETEKYESFSANVQWLETVT